MTAIINPKLQEIFDFAKSKAPVIFNKDGYHSPLFLLDVPDKGLGLCPMSWDGNDEKTNMLNAMKEAFREMGGARYVGIVESWMATDTREEYESGTFVPPSQRPDKKEIVMIFGEDIDGSCLMGAYHIVRPNGEKPRLGEFEAWDCAKHGGDIHMMRGMFAAPTTH